MFYNLPQNILRTFKQPTCDSGNFDNAKFAANERFQNFLVHQVQYIFIMEVIKTFKMIS